MMMITELEKINSGFSNTIKELRKEKEKLSRGIKPTLNHRDYTRSIDRCICQVVTAKSDLNRVIEDLRKNQRK